MTQRDDTFPGTQKRHKITDTTLISTLVATMCLKPLKGCILVLSLLVIANANEKGNDLKLEYDYASDFSSDLIDKKSQPLEETTSFKEVVTEESKSDSINSESITSASVLSTSGSSEHVETTETTTVSISPLNPETTSNSDLLTSTQVTTESVLIPEERLSTDSSVNISSLNPETTNSAFYEHDLLTTTETQETTTVELKLITKAETTIEEEPIKSSVNNSESDTQVSKQPSIETEDVCLTGDSLTEKINKIIEENIPIKVHLKDAKMGRRIILVLSNGFLNLGSGKLSGDPLCQIGTDKKVYTFFMDFNDITGAYDWKLYNLFGYNFTESALLTLNHLKAEFTFVERMSIVGKRISLKHLSLSPLQNLAVKVNIPEKIMEIKAFNRAINFITSRLNTFVMNRSKSAIAKYFQDSFVKAVNEKGSIHP